MKRLNLLMLMMVACFVAGGVTAQTIHGDIRGRVSDTSGSALPGVTVSLTSPALPGNHSVVSGDNGEFKLLLLPPGTYIATSALVGYQTQQQANIKVGIDTTVWIDITMEAAFSGEIVVNVDPPLVNTTHATIGTDVSKEFFLDLPNNRDYASVASIAPGVQNDASGQTYYGSTGAENAYFIDGANTTEIERGVQGMELNFEFIDEIQVKAGAYSAEYGHSTGGLINVITRSGSNEFHGDIFGYYDSDSLRAPLKGGAEGGGVSATSKTVDTVRSDFGLDLGGYMVRDRLWFFAAYDRVANTDTNQVLDDYGAVVPGAPMEGEQFSRDTTRDLFAAKLTWRPDANHSLSGSIFGNPTTKSGAIPYFAAPPSYYLNEEITGGTDGAVNYDGVFGQNVVLSARFASHHEMRELKGPGRDLNGFFDDSDPFGNGIRAVGWEGVEAGWGGYSEEDFSRDQLNADLSWFVGNLAGSHEFKVGGEYEEISLYDASIRSGHVGATVGRHNCYPGYHYCGESGEHLYYYSHSFLTFGFLDPQTVTPDDIRLEFVRDITNQNAAVYLQDRWQVSPGLSLDIGVRWSRQKLFNNHGGIGLEIDDNWAPRLGFVWDALGNGKSKIFGHWGRFYQTIPGFMSMAAFGGGSPNYITYNFSDDPSDIAQPPAGDAPRPFIFNPFTGDQASDPETRGQYLSEAVLGFKYEFAPNYAIGLTYLHRSLARVVEDVATPNLEFIIGNPGDGMISHSVGIAYYYSLLGVLPPCPDGTLDCHVHEVPGARRVFDGFEIALTKRFSNNFQFLSSLMWSRLEGNYDGAYYASTGQLAPNLNSAFDTSDFAVNNTGPLSNDRTWQFKFDGIYRFGFGLSSGLSAYYRSGTPMTAMGFSYGLGNWEYYLSERGAFGRTDAEWEADIHLGYPVPLGKRLQLNLMVDIFNIFNRQDETGRSTRYDWQYNGFEDYQPIDPFTGEPNPPIVPNDPDRPPLNPSWNTTNSWQEPRTIRLGVRLSF